MSSYLVKNGITKKERPYTSFSEAFKDLEKAGLEAERKGFKLIRHRMERDVSALVEFVEPMSGQKVSIVLERKAV
jgi:hypothetical protein